MSFSTDTSLEHILKAALTALNIQILAIGHRCDPNDKKYSALQLTSHSNKSREGVAIIIVAQANIISKIIQLGKLIQYYNNTSKSKVELYYTTFLKCFKILCLVHYLKTQSNITQDHFSPSLQRKIESVHT